MQFQSFIEWAFLGVVSSGVWVLWLMKQDLTKLNIKIEVLITEHLESKKKIEDHEYRIRDLEKQ
jgi:hypothetical protein